MEGTRNLLRVVTVYSLFEKTMQYDIYFLSIAYKCTVGYLSLTKIFRNDRKYKNFSGFYVFLWSYRAETKTQN